MKKYSTHQDTAKQVTSLFIVLIAFGVFLLFYKNTENILQPENFYPFITAVTVLSGLLVGLLYLVNNSAHPQKAVAHKHKKKKK